MQASQVPMMLPALDLNVTEDLMLGDDFLDVSKLGDEVVDRPPIGLQLRKSESFLALINDHLQKATQLPTSAQEPQPQQAAV